MENLHILAANNISDNSNGFYAVAVFTHKPTFEEIMALDNFSKNTTLDRNIAENIVKYEHCGIFNNESGFHFEYALLTPKGNGDLCLNDYLYTGYLSPSDEASIIVAN